MDRCIAVLQHVGADYVRRRPRAADYYAILMNEAPRHTEIVDILAKKICKDLGIQPVK